MVCEKASLISSHAEMVDEKGTRRGRVGGWVKGAIEGLKYDGDIFIEVSHFSRHGTHDFGLIWREMFELLSPLCVLHLEKVSVDASIWSSIRLPACFPDLRTLGRFSKLDFVFSLVFGVVPSRSRIQ